MGQSSEFITLASKLAGLNTIIPTDGLVRLKFGAQIAETVVGKIIDCGGQLLSKLYPASIVKKQPIRQPQGCQIGQFWLCKHYNQKRSACRLIG